MDEVLDEIKFLRDLVVSPRTPASVRTTPSVDLIGESGFCGLAEAAKSLVDNPATSQPVETME